MAVPKFKLFCGLVILVSICFLGTSFSLSSNNDGVFRLNPTDSLLTVSHLSPNLISPFQVATTAVSDNATVFNSKLYLFGIGTEDHAHYMNVFDGVQWTGWTLIPGGGTSALSDTATVFNSELYLFGIGINDHAHYMNI